MTMNETIALLEGENKRVLPEYYFGQKPIYTKENRELFDLITLNCLAANLPSASYYPTEDVLVLVRKMFKEGASRYPCAGINIDRFCTDMLVGKLDRHGVYQYLMGPFRTRQEKIDSRDMSYTLLLILLIPTPPLEPLLYRSTMLSLYALQYAITNTNGAKSDLDANKLKIWWHLKDLITRCNKKNNMQGEMWMWGMVEVLKQYAIIYLSALLDRYSEYPTLKLINNQAFNTALSAHREVVKTQSNPTSMKGMFKREKTRPNKKPNRNKV